MGVDIVARTALEGRPAGWFAPTYKILGDAWREATAALAPAVRSVDKSDKRIELLTGGVIEFWSLEKPDAGRSRKYAEVVVDEAGVVRDLSDRWNMAIRPTLADFKGGGWMLGTPKGRGDFYRFFALGTGNKPGWACFSGASQDNPIIDPAEVQAALDAGMPHHVWRQEFFGEPADDGGNPFGLQAIAECVAPMSVAKPAVYGVDLAKSDDWTVVIGLDEDGAVCYFDRWQGPWLQTMPRLIQKIGYTQALVDSTGVGDPIVEQLQRELPLVEGFKFSSTSKQQLMEGLAAAIQTRGVRYPDGEIRRELEVFEYEYTKNGVRYSAPQGLHDDCVCALALAVKKLRGGKRLTFGAYVPDDDEPEDW